MLNRSEDSNIDFEETVECEDEEEYPQPEIKYDKENIPEEITDEANSNSPVPEYYSSTQQTHLATAIGKLASVQSFPLFNLQFSLFCREKESNARTSPSDASQLIASIASSKFRWILKHI